LRLTQHLAEEDLVGVGDDVAVEPGDLGPAAASPSFLAAIPDRVSPFLTL
jgi:hypothetical protein